MSDDRFDWLEEDAARLNGSSSFRSSVRWDFSQPGDAIVGEVVSAERMEGNWGSRWPDGKGSPIVTVRCERGRSGGQDIEAGEWVKVYFSAAELRRTWEQCGGIKVGDRLILGYEGTRPYKSSGAIKHVFSAAVERAPGAAAATEVPW